jgi:ligand-binding sensor domain-containing protein
MTSQDGGQTWVQAAEGLADSSIFDLLITQSSAEDTVRVWAATRNGLFWRDEAGESWQAAKRLPSAAVFALAADASGRLYVGLDGAGVYAETPDKSGWESLALVEPLASAGVLAVAVSPDGQQLYGGTSGLGLFASRDGGRSWTVAYPDEYVANIALNPDNPGIAVASLRDRLVRTQDGGQSWQALAAPWGNEWVVSLLWLADGTLGAGTARGRFYQSLDNGDFWAGGKTDLPPHGVLDLAVAETPARAGVTPLLAGSWTGLYGSKDGGQSWQILAPATGNTNTEALLATEHELFLGARTGLYRWASEQRRWVLLPSDLPSGIASIAVDPQDPQLLYAGLVSDGVYRSQDGGASWQALPALQKGIPAIAIDPKESHNIYILAAWERVYESHDGGESWGAQWSGLGEVIEAVSLVVDPVESLVYVGTEFGLYRRKQGDDWLPVAPELADQSILALLARPDQNFLQGTILYIGATRGVYRSFDHGDTVEGGGGSWGQGLENISVTALLTHPQDSQQLFAGTADSGVYYSGDGGQSWQPIGPADLTEGVVESLAWGPNGELFVVATGGVWLGERE